MSYPAAHPPPINPENMNAIIRAAITKPADYIIRNNASTYEAIDGATGILEYESATAHSLIEDVIAVVAGGRVHIKDSITITDNIDITDTGTVVTGNGYGTKITQSTANKNCFVVTGAQHVGIFDMWLRGTGAGTGSAVNATTASHRFAASGLFIDTWGNNGVQIVSSDEAQVYSNKFNAVGAGTGGQCAIFAQTCNNSLFTGNKIRSCYGGITLDTNSTKNVVSANKIKSNLYDGITLETGCHYNTVTANVLSSPAHHGIWILDSSDNIVSSNVVLDADVNNTSTYDGICISTSAATSDRNLIVANRVRNSDRYEIHIADADCNKTMVYLNQIYGDDHAGTLVDNGTNTASDHNGTT